MSHPQRWIHGKVIGKKGWKIEGCEKMNWCHWTRKEMDSVVREQRLDCGYINLNKSLTSIKPWCH